jgi:hypothetical protein
VQVNNQGTVWADTAGGNISLGGFGGFDNRLGTVKVTAATTLSLANFNATAGIGTWSHTAGTVTLNGSFNNAGNVLALDNNTSDWVFGGTINNGTVSDTGGHKLIANGGTISGVTVSGSPFDLTASGASLAVSNGLTLNGTIALGNSGTGSAASLSFTTVETIGGTGDIQFASNNSANALGTPYSSVYVTIGSGITIHSKPSTATSGTISVPIVNQGTLWADAAGDNFNVADTGSVLPTSGFDNHGGTIKLTTASTLNFSGNLDVRSGVGTWQHTAGTVNVTGGITNSGNTLALNSNTGDWILTGAVNNGTVSDSGGNHLIIGGGSNATLNGVTIWERIGKRSAGGSQP